MEIGSNAPAAIDFIFSKLYEYIKVLFKISFTVILFFKSIVRHF